MNVLAVALNFVLVDWLLNGKFGLYGYRAVQYMMTPESEYMMTPEGERIDKDKFVYNPDKFVYNPMCHAFPTLVS